MTKFLFLNVLLFVLLNGCNSDGVANEENSTNLDSSVQPITDGNWYTPSLFVTWHWQLEGNIDTSYSVEIYDIDLFNTSVETIQELQSSGKKVICYFSAGSYEDFRDDRDKFFPEELGNTLDGWENERWLDIRSANVLSIMKDRLDLAQQKGCDGVEPDNMDGYLNNSGFSLTASNQLAFNRFIANEAHKRNLAVGLKNDLDQISELVDYYDFAVNEQCFEFNECDALASFTENEKPVLNAEYLNKYVTDVAERSALCNQSINMNFSTLILPLDLDNAFRYSCL